jgi:glycosyltransferase involved in cell wall biosynthesis
VTPLQNAHRYRGIGTYVRGLAHHLAAQTEIPIEFWGWAGDEPLDVRPPHRALWLPRFPMPQYRGAWLFAQLAMRLRARRSSIAAVHVTDPDALTPIKGRKLLATVYDLIPLQEGIDARRFVAWAGYRTYLRALRRVDTYFAISSQTAGDLNRLLRIPESRIVVASPGIELPASTNGIVAGAEGPYFLFVGGSNRNKNSEVLLDAMAICSELPHRLLIAGRWLPRQLEDLQGRLRGRGLLGRVEHLGFVPDADLVSLMRRACALVVPSRQEGFGLPVGEGLAAGAVVIHSRLPVLEETAGGASMTFDPDSATELAERLRQVAGDARLGDDLRRRGVLRARDLTWTTAVARTLAAYRAALGGGATPCE